MDAQELRRLIALKRDGHAVPAESWKAIVDGYVADTVDEAQLASLLMAVTLNGIDGNETIALTQAMVASGEILHYSKHPVIDKHSSGGVGDTVSLLAVPIAAAAGVHVAKLAGRALGHTGGTIDKLEVLPGVRTDLSPERFIELVETIGCAIASQSAKLVPADRKIYALRDRTATVPSVGLIAASIVSKKIAAGADAIVYDVKVGRGAFMHDLDRAKALAERIVCVTKSFGKPSLVFITDMDEPLGRQIGDGLEVLEAFAILRGEQPLTERLPKLAVRLAQAMIDLAGLSASAKEMVTSGKAFERLEMMLEAQGADLVACRALVPSSVQTTLRAESDGYITSIDPVAVGEAARSLVLKYGSFAGLQWHVAVGDKVRIGDPLLTVYGDEIANQYVSCLTIGVSAPTLRPLIAFELDGR
jgi:pyrimidine-nucleoside phosphorylase